MTDTTHQLHFFRCRICLATVTLTEHVSAGVCGVCNGWLEYLGPVKQDRYAKTETRCACDSRCTYATGPNCDCSCGGANHGASQLADRVVVVEQGRVQVTPAHDIEKHAAVAAEYRAAVEAAEQRMRAAFGNKLDTFEKRGDPREWLPYEVWSAINRAKKLLKHARELKVHALRMKKLLAICA